MAVRMRLCIPCLLASVALAVWSAAAWGQPPGGSRGGFGFDRVLKRHDKDGDGKVTREEWQGAAEVFGRMDTDGDGVITQAEFQARTPGRAGSGSQPEISPLEAARQLDLAGLLRLLDTNQDGSLSRGEFRQFFERIDSDKNGLLSKEELDKALIRPTAAGGKPMGAPSIVAGRKAGIEVGQYPPDFELQPIEPYAKLREWLGDAAPMNIDDKVRLSQLVGKQPILLLYGSYT